LQLEERVLLRRLSRGDAEAFWPLWIRHRLHLQQVCLRHMSGIAADACDAVSRSMLVAFRKLPVHARDIVNLQAWLTTLTRHVCVDMRRERQRLNAIGIAVDDLAVFDSMPGHDPVPSPEQVVLANEFTIVMRRAIGSLPPLLREVARMRFLQEASYQTIASSLSITEATARKRVQQARSVLRHHC
jgi:RNA polymerase sigma factor (sigma-70 family)